MKHFLLVILAVATLDIVHCQDEDVNKATEECQKEYLQGTKHADLPADYRFYCFYKCATDKSGLTDENGNFNMNKLEELNKKPFTDEQLEKIKECEEDPKNKGVCENNMCRQIFLTALCIDQVMENKNTTNTEN